MDHRLFRDMTIRLRPATIDDAPLLASWDHEPHVIRATTDDENAYVAFGDHDWRQDLAAQSEVQKLYIAERGGLPIGVLQIIDPKREPTHYWGDCEDNLRAIDIWIGPASELGRGSGTEMMRQAIELCFASPEVEAIIIDPLTSNTRAHAFYRRLGFLPEGRRLLGEDDCLVHRLTRANWQKIRPEPGS
jgi:aminoglycoside 6'-N-acetyltransferase